MLTKLRIYKVLLVLALIYSTIMLFVGIPRNNYALLILVLILQIGVATLCGLTARTLLKSIPLGIILGIVSVFFLVNTIVISFLLIYYDKYLIELLSKTDGNEEPSMDAAGNKFVFKDYIKKNKVIIFGVCVGLVVIIIGCFAYRSYRIQVQRSVDLANYYYNIRVAEEETKSLQKRKDDIANDFNTNVIVLGSAIDKSNPYMYKVTGTVQNKGKYKYFANAKVVFYDAKNVPIATEECKVSIGTNEIEGFSVTLFDNTQNVRNYEVKLEYINTY